MSFVRLPCYNCAVSGTGFIDSGTLATSGSVSGTASASWVGYPSNAFRHFKDHGADFGAKNAVDYVHEAQDFLHNPGDGVLSKTRANDVE